ncbi:MAG TPA: MmcQ/YjbR family DNA-binding protein [Citricoccus sp.]
MNGDRLQALARDRAEELPGAAMSHPFGPEHEVYKVRGKVFMLLTELDGDPVLTLKAEPEDATALRSAYPQIIPGYHMNKRHWITVRPGEGVDAALARELVTDSYRLVVAGLPRDQRPVDPESFGGPQA